MRFFRLQAVKQLTASEFIAVCILTAPCSSYQIVPIRPSPQISSNVGITVRCSMECWMLGPTKTTRCSTTVHGEPHSVSTLTLVASVAYPAAHAQAFSSMGAGKAIPGMRRQ